MCSVQGKVNFVLKWSLWGFSKEKVEYLKKELDQGRLLIIAEPSKTEPQRFQTLL